MASVCFGWHSLSVVLSCEIFENTLQAGTNKNLTTSVSILWARASFGTSVNNALTTKSPLPVHLAMVPVVNATGWDSPTTLNKAELRVSAEERAEIIAREPWPNGLIHRWLQNLLRPMGVGGPGSLLRLHFSLLPGGHGWSLSPLGSRWHDPILQYMNWTLWNHEPE